MICMGWPRYAVASLLGFALLVAACGVDSGDSAGSSDGIVEVTVACAPTLSSLPREYAMRSGIDDDHGVEINCVQVQSGPEISAALIDGEIDLTLMTPPNLFALLEQDVDVVAFMAVLDREAGDLIVRSDFPLPSSDAGWEGVMADLQEATISVPARGAAAEDLARALFVEAGLDPDEATYVATGLPATTVAALRNAEIDAAITIEPGITLALEAGIAVQPFSLQGQTGPPTMDWASLMLVTTRTYAEQNSDVLERFASMWQVALQWLRNPGNRAEAIELTGDFLELDPGIAEVLFERNLPFWSESPRLEPDRFDQVGDFYRDVGRFQRAYHVEDYGFDLDE